MLSLYIASFWHTPLFDTHIIYPSQLNGFSSSTNGSLALYSDGAIFASVLADVCVQQANLVEVHRYTTDNLIIKIMFLHSPNTDFPTLTLLRMRVAYLLLLPASQRTIRCAHSTQMFRRRCLHGCVCTAVTSMPAALRTLQRPLDEVDMGLISGDARGSGLRHLMRIAQLVLACAVQSDRRDDYIAVVLDLPEAAQEILMQLVSDVMPAESDSGPVAEATSSTAVVTPLSPRGGGLQKRARASVLSSAGRHHPIASPMSPSSETEGKRTRVSSTPSGPMDKIRPPQHVATSPQFTHRQLERENEILQEEVVRTV